MRILTGPTRAHRWIVGAGIHGCWLGTYERSKQIRIRKELKQGMTGLDIGANTGFYTLLMARSVGAAGRVVSFEPSPQNLGFLQQHLALNSIGNVDLRAEAVSDFVGTAHFAADRGSYQGALAANGETQVQVVSLDHLWRTGSLPPADVAKIDVEGAEFSVLKGAESYLRRFRPILFLAVHSPDLNRQCSQFLRVCGYKVESLDTHSAPEESDELIARTH